MQFNIPIFVEKNSKNIFCLRPLLFQAPFTQHAKLREGILALSKELRPFLRQCSQDKLWGQGFFCEFHSEKMELSFHWKKRLVKEKFFVVSFKTLGRTVAFLPKLQDVWFVVERGESLRERSSEVLQKVFHNLENNPKDYASLKSAWIYPLSLDVQIPSKIGDPAPKFSQIIFGMGSERKFVGWEELEKTGECLNHLYPEDLPRAYFREQLVEEIYPLLTEHNDPILLVGPRGCGKTAIVQEIVYRFEESRKTHRRRSKKKTWLLFPQRIVAGMMYLGEWQQRFLAILDYLQEKNHILFFDNLLGLFQNGDTTRKGSSLGHFLKQYMDGKNLSVVAEITPEEFRIIQEEDKGFIDSFKVFHIPPVNEVNTLQILIHHSRVLEDRYRCTIEALAFQPILNLTRRYLRQSVFPGKAVQFLSRLTRKYSGEKISEKIVLQDFSEMSGFSVGFLDSSIRLSREEIEKNLQEKVIGQSNAVKALTDSIIIAKAAIQDAQRPLGSFLFLGTTGVGKTEMAKAAASYLFTDESFLIRFDMNEFIEAESVTRLIGTLYRPDGLLTNPIQQKPFAVILFDEVEKAHPYVFDLLLQVLGEGRLTDAAGRVADFCNCIIIMTSNLGAGKAQNKIGLKTGSEDNSEIYQEAAQKFFRPEFFNRIDQVVPFSSLDRPSLQKIASILIRKVFSREGLVRRQILLNVDQGVIDLVVRKGYHPELGARPLKRAIEKHIALPLSLHLAQNKTSLPAIINITCQKENVDISFHLLKEKEQKESLFFSKQINPETIHKYALSLKEMVGEKITRLETFAGESIPLEKLEEEDYDVMFLKEEGLELLPQLEDFIEKSEPRPDRHVLFTSRATKRKIDVRRDWGGNVLERVAEAYEKGKEVHQVLIEWSEEMPKEDELQENLRQLTSQVCLWQTGIEYLKNSTENEVFLIIESLADQRGKEELAQLLKTYEELAQKCKYSFFAWKKKGSDQTAHVIIKGPGVKLIFEKEVGIHLFFQMEGKFIPLKVETLSAPQSPNLEDWDYPHWRKRIPKEEFIPVTRIVDPRNVIYDCRTGLVLEDKISGEILLEILSADFEWPED